MTSALAACVARLRRIAAVADETPLPADLPSGHYVAPVALQVARYALPAHEVFGPGPARSRLRPGGAVVGVQPFGGEELSGTGREAGGQRTLLPFATERTLSVNTAALGGVTELLAAPDRGEVRPG
jgi:delta 1-pyrroline-5-carboxylate dehydrogenase